MLASEVIVRRRPTANGFASGEDSRTLLSVWKAIGHWLVLLVMGANLLLVAMWPLLQDMKL